MTRKKRLSFGSLRIAFKSQLLVVLGGDNKNIVYVLSNACRTTTTTMASIKPFKRAATTGTKRFQDREIAGLTTYLRQFGPFPES